MRFVKIVIASIFLSLLLSTAVAHSEEPETIFIGPDFIIQLVDEVLPPGNPDGIDVLEHEQLGVVFRVQRGMEGEAIATLLRTISDTVDAAQEARGHAKILADYVLLLQGAANTDDPDAILEHLRANPVFPDAPLDAAP